MTDPSGKYYFDVNPKRNNNLLNPNDLLFKAHYVNDAFFADFTPIVTAAKDLRRNDVDFKAQSQELDNAAAELAIEYLESSCDSFNVVMCGFGPPPLMAYVATRPVQRGQELLASYGLGYWLGKAFADDDERVLDAALAALEEKSEVRKAQSQADRIIETALGAGDRAIQSDFQVHTTLIKGMFRALRKEKRKRSRNN